MGRKKIQRVTGMYDILPDDFLYYKKVLETVEEIAGFYNFQRIETPILERKELFEKGTGITTDIVEKEMYTLKTKGGDVLALRPEGTPPIVRAYIEHGMQNLPQPVKLWYFGPFFRHEKPQSGRHRQFWQFGLEVINSKDPALDAQVIKIFYEIFQELGLKDIVIEVNSIGDSCCRPYYKKILKSYFKKREKSLPSLCREKLRKNPLRVLDCKEEKAQIIINQAPQMADHLCQECKEHFKEVLEFLDELDVSYDFNPYLVRGLDYYTRTVFEIFTKEEKEKKGNALAGGGRYDHLIKILGGEDIPAVGGAGGVERIIQEMKEKEILAKKKKRPQIFLAQIGKDAKKKAAFLLEEFRKAKIPVYSSLGKDSLKVQLKIADRLKVRYTLLIGQKEVVDGNIIIRDMEKGKQKVIALKSIVKEVKKILKKK